jgi:DNA polymerase I-like protein with 3'-5' exonuclease and polymerase domains
MPRWKGYKYEPMATAALLRANKDTPHTVAIDTETSGFGWYDEPFCATITWLDDEDELQSFYIDLEGDGWNHRAELLKTIIGGAERWVFHNAKFDLQKLAMADALPGHWKLNHLIEDTATIYALINENDTKRLKYLANKILGESTNEEEVLKKVRRKLKLKKDDGYHLLPRNVVLPYALKDTEFTLRLYNTLRPRLPEDMDDLYLFEIGLELDLLEIEGHGIGLDIPYLTKTASEYGVKVMKGQAALVKLTGKADFNANSPKQITEAFAEQFGVELTSTDKETMQGIIDYKGAHKGKALAKALLEYRSDKKLHSTYLLAMLAEQRDGIIHPNFNLTTPRTGRMSSGQATNN